CTPDSRSGMASSSEVTPSHLAPSASRALEHSTAPCPYASALTTAQTVTAGPTCFCTVRKFWRRVARDTSAQVGRVAARLRISAVLATLAIIAGVPRTPRLRWGYSRDSSAPDQHRC